MAAISLREYHRNLEKLLRQDVTDRVIGHCRHILQVYPRNGETYRLLGRALAASGQWEQAADILRRVLSVYPDDDKIHETLATVYQRLNQPDAAIWHLERALEVQPNNVEMLGALRRLYREQRGVELGKIPLTSSAAAHQYQRSGMYSKTVAAIQQALERDPIRVDLRLLLARTYWEHGEMVSAAEAALQVLDELPFCFDANRILAALWLAEGRPSDATPYLNVMEQIDPYIALELVQDDPVPDDTFAIEELNFQRLAQQELVASGVNLFGDLDIEDVDEEVLKAAVLDDVAPVGGDDFFATEVPPDWVGDDDAPLAADDDDPLAWMSEEGSGLTGMLADERATDDDDDPLAWMNQGGSGLTGMLADERATDDDDPLAWMNQGGSGLTGMLDAPDDDPLAPGGNPAEWMGGDSKADDPNDPLAWLTGAGGELLDEGEAGSEVYNEAEALRADTEDGFTGSLASDPMAWLGDDFRDPDAPADDGPDDDLLAWMTEDNSEFAETGPLAERPTPGAPAEDELLDWMGEDDDALLDEMISMEALATDGDDEDLADLFALMDEDDGGGRGDGTDDLSSLFASVDDSGDDDVMAFAERVDAQGDDPDDIDDLADLFAEAEAADQAAAPGGVDSFDALFAEDDALAEDEDDFADLFGGDDALTEDDDFADLFGGDDALAEDDDLADLFGDDAEDDSLAWLGEMGGDSALDDDDEPDWMVSEGDTSDFGATVNLSTDELAAEADALDWMTAFDDDGDAEPDMDAPALGGGEPLMAEDDADDPMGWLTAYDGDDADDEDPAGTVMLPTTDDMAGDDALDWMGAPDAEPLADDAEDWLAGLPDPEADDEMADDGGLDWLENLQADDAFLASSVSERQTAALPYREEVDWLADVGDDEPEDPLTDTDDDFDVLADAAAIAEGDRPDWLSAIQTGGLQDEDDGSALDEVKFTEQSDEEGEETMRDDMFNNDDQPDWLSSLGDDDGDDVGFDDDADQLDWLADDGDDEDALFGGAADAVAEEQPDWLSGLDDDGEDELFGGAAEDAVAEEQPDWLSGLDYDGDDEDALFGGAAEDAVAEEQPDWLSGLDDDGDEEDELFGGAADAVAEEQPDWLSGLDDDGEDEDALFGGVEEDAVAEDQPDWLSGLGDDGEDELFGGVEEDAVAEEQPDWLSGLDYDGDEEDALFGGAAEDAVAEEQPDWLSGLDEDGDEEDELFGGAADAVAEEQPDWLSGLGEDGEDELFGGAAEDAVVEEQPDWLSGLGEDGEDELFGGAAEDAVVEEQPDWLSGLGEDGEDELFGGNLPDADADLEWVENEGVGSLFDADDADMLPAAVGTGSLFDDEAEDDEGPNWLAGLDDEPSEADLLAEDWLPADAEADPTAGLFDEVPEPEAEAEPDWLASMDMADETLAEQEAPSWLDDARPFEADVVAADDAGFDDPFDNDEVAVAGAVGMGAAAALGAMHHDTADDDDVPEAETVPGWLTFDPDDELLREADAEAEYEIDTIDAAPEWLNAMVPGLDLDFAPEDDEPIETAFLDAEAGHRTREALDTETGNPTRAFKWLLDIIEAEAESVVAPARRRPRFVFTRPPLWRWRRDNDDSDDDMLLDDLAGDSDPAKDEPAWLDDAFDD